MSRFYSKPRNVSDFKYKRELLSLMGFKFDIEKFFQYLRIENSLILLGVFTFLISVYNEYILGMKLGFLFLLFGAIFRFYNLSIVTGIFNNYMNNPKYLKEKKIFDRKANKYIKIEKLSVPFKDSWHIFLADFLSCLFILFLLIYSFILVIE